MKLVINFDFINAVLDVNQKFGPFKIIRNNKKRWFMVNFPFYMIIDCVVLKKASSVYTALSFQFFLLIIKELMIKSIIGKDIYKEESIKKLKILSSSLKKLNINTDYDLLLSSTLYSRKYKINFNKDEIPNILESKYILVPTNDFNNSVKEVSILQEHNVGSNTYVLSIGSPKKEFSLVYQNS